MDTPIEQKDGEELEIQQQDDSTSLISFFEISEHWQIWLEIHVYQN